MLALILTTPFVLKTIGLHTCIRDAIDGRPELQAATKAGVAGTLLPVSQPPVGGALGAGEIGGVSVPPPPQRQHDGDVHLHVPPPSRQ